MSTDTTAIDAIVCRRLRAALEAMFNHAANDDERPPTPQPTYLDTSDVRAALATLPPPAAECAGFVCAGVTTWTGTYHHEGLCYRTCRCGSCQQSFSNPVHQQRTECTEFACSSVNIDGYFVGYGHTNHDGVSTCSGECRCTCGLPFSAHAAPAAQAAASAPPAVPPSVEYRERLQQQAMTIVQQYAEITRLKAPCDDMDATLADERDIHAYATAQYERCAALERENDRLEAQLELADTSQRLTGTYAREQADRAATAEADVARLRERLSRLSSPIQDERNSEE